MIMAKSAEWHVVCLIEVPFPGAHFECRMEDQENKSILASGLKSTGKGLGKTFYSGG